MAQYFSRRQNSERKAPRSPCEGGMREAVAPRASLGGADPVRQLSERPSSGARMPPPPAVPTSRRYPRSPLRTGGQNIHRERSATSARFADEEPRVRDSEGRGCPCAARLAILSMSLSSPSSPFSPAGPPRPAFHPSPPAARLRAEGGGARQDPNRKESMAAAVMVAGGRWPRATPHAIIPAGNGGAPLCGGAQVGSCGRCLPICCGLGEIRKRTLRTPSARWANPPDD